AHDLLLRHTGLNFVGRIEATEIPRGIADVVVCTGYVGHMVMSLLEGVGDTILSLARYAYKARLLMRAALGMLSGGVGRLKRRTAPRLRAAPRPRPPERRRSRHRQCHQGLGQGHRQRPERRDPRAPLRAGDAAHGMIAPKHIFRWDLDKTYLRTDFDSFRGLIKAAMEKPAEKRAVPGAPALLRALRAAGGADHRICIITGSPQ